MVRVALAGLLASSSLFAGCAPRHASSGFSNVPTLEVHVRDVTGRPLDASEADAHDDGRAVGDLVEVEWRGSWWPAILVERRRAGWFVHYEGYSKDWDEVASIERIRDRRVSEDVPALEPMDEDVDP